MTTDGLRMPGHGLRLPVCAKGLTAGLSLPLPAASPHPSPHGGLLTGTPKGILLELRLDPTSPPLRSFLSLWINQKDQVGQRKGIPG